jgi:hypothetical protein
MGPYGFEYIMFRNEIPPFHSLLEQKQIIPPLSESLDAQGRIYQ